jgi:ankyrin repeat protein
MNEVILRQIKTAISHNLDEKAGQIIRSRGSYLSRRDLFYLMLYMNRLNKHPYNVIEYIYYVPPYRDIFEKNLRSQAYFHRACRDGHANEVRLFLTIGYNSIDPAKDDSYGLRAACLSGRTEVVQILLEDGRSNPSVLSSEPIRLAVSSRFPDIVRLLLNDGRADPSCRGSSALLCACDSGETEIVRMLLEDGRSYPYTSNNYAIREASAKGYIDIVCLLLEDGRTDPSVENNQALCSACTEGPIDLIRLLLEDERVVRAGLNGAKRTAKLFNRSCEIISLLMASV